MGLANGYVFRIPADREAVFRECIENDEPFGEPVTDFAHSRRVPLVCFVISREQEITHIAQGKRGVKSGTGLRRLNISDAVSLKPRYENVGRYFDNGAFATMVGNAWIGSTPDQSLLLEQVIRATIESGKAVVVAIKNVVSVEDETSENGEFLQ